jgi:uncharacterized repeat protein (TIGR03803 family)
MVTLRRIFIAAFKTLFSAKPLTQPTLRFTAGNMHKFAASALIFVIVFALGAVMTTLANAQTFTVLYNFKGVPDGDSPNAGLVIAVNGNLYGTTISGGTGACYEPYGCGTVFSLSGKKETVLYSFDGTPDGAFPILGGLARDSEGNLYGSTGSGGTGSCLNQQSAGCGTVFKVKGKKETVLYSFNGQPDGATPNADLLLDSVGNIYGTTYSGGIFSSGTVFKLDTRGNEVVLYNFGSKGVPDGGAPNGRLIMDEAGNLYGTTASGGAHRHGTVFKLDTIGVETVLYSFCAEKNCADGTYPNAGLIMDAAGNLYGTTSWGGGVHSRGTVFKLDTSGTETVLHGFHWGTTDGYIPGPGLVMDAMGNLYGMTSLGGAHSQGTVFKLDMSGNETVLHSFCAAGTSLCTDGEQPIGNLVMDVKGNLYGTAAGGSNSAGIVFKLTP